MAQAYGLSGRLLLLARQARQAQARPSQGWAQQASQPSQSGGFIIATLAFQGVEGGFIIPTAGMTRPRAPWAPWGLMGLMGPMGRHGAPMGAPCSPLWPHVAPMHEAHCIPHLQLLL